MSRTLSDAQLSLSVPINSLVQAEILRGASFDTVITVLAGITGAVAAGAIDARPADREHIHAVIDEGVAMGLCALKKQRGQRS